jgi:hypothetical protein
METRRPRLPVAVTLDVHAGDVPDEIVHSAEWLHTRGIAATYFIPSSLLADRAYMSALRLLPHVGHEVASHTHEHSVEEADALGAETRAGLDFLATSRDRHADFFGVAPRAFRSPGWCVLGPAALDVLEELGYVADSSATPQRLSMLSSRPYHAAWTFSARRPYRLRPNLLEVPTSTALVPAGSPTFLIFRRTLSTAFVRGLALEARLDGARPVVLQFHAGDFNPRARQAPPWGPLSPADFVLRRQGGFGFKHRLKSMDRRQIAATTEAVVRVVEEGRFDTLSTIALEILGRVACTASCVAVLCLQAA